MSFHYLHFRTFARATESPDKVKEALALVTGDAEIVATETEGHFGNPILIFEVRLKRNRQIKNFFVRLREAGLLELLTEELDERLDDDCCLHLRLDKQKAYAGTLETASGPDVIDCRMKVAAYPANRESATSTARDYLSKLISNR